MLHSDLVSELLFYEPYVDILPKGEVVDHIAKVKVVTLLQNHTESEVISGVG